MLGKKMRLFYLESITSRMLKGSKRGKRNKEGYDDSRCNWFGVKIPADLFCNCEYCQKNILHSPQSWVLSHEGIRKKTSESFHWENCCAGKKSYSPIDVPQSQILSWKSVERLFETTYLKGFFSPEFEAPNYEMLAMKSAKANARTGITQFWSSKIAKGSVGNVLTKRPSISYYDIVRNLSIQLGILFFW